MTRYDETGDLLVGRAKDGSDAAFGEIFDRLRPTVRRGVARRLGGRHVRRVDPSDVVQETYIVAHRQFRAGFRGSTLREAFKFILTISRRVLGRGIRHQTRAKRSVDGEAALSGTSGSGDALRGLPDRRELTPVRRLVRRESARLVEQELADLPPPQAEAVRLRYFDDCQFAEIGERLGRTPGAAAGLVHRGVRELRSRLREKYDMEHGPL